MAWNRSIRWGTYIALATGLIFGSASNASADACWDHWRAKLNAISAEELKNGARLKATGDCSYVQKIMDGFRHWRALGDAVPCQNMSRTHVSGLSENAFRAKLMRYCKQSPKPPRQEIAKVQPESPKIPRQKTAKVQPETRPSRPSTQMPAKPLNPYTTRAPASGRSRWTAPPACQRRSISRTEWHSTGTG